MRFRLVPSGEVQAVCEPGGWGLEEVGLAGCLWDGRWRGHRGNRWKVGAGLSQEDPPRSLQPQDQLSESVVWARQALSPCSVWLRGRNEAQWRRRAPTSKLLMGNSLERKKALLNLGKCSSNKWDLKAPRVYPYWDLRIRERDWVSNHGTKTKCAPKVNPAAFLRAVQRSCRGVGSLGPNHRCMDSTSGKLLNISALVFLSIHRKIIKLTPKGVVLTYGKCLWSVNHCYSLLVYHLLSSPQPWQWHDQHVEKGSVSAVDAH